MGKRECKGDARSMMMFSRVQVVGAVHARESERQPVVPSCSADGAVKGFCIELW